MKSHENQSNNVYWNKTWPDGDLVVAASTNTVT